VADTEKNQHLLPLLRPTQTNQNPEQPEKKKETPAMSKKHINLFLVTYGQDEGTSINSLEKDHRQQLHALADVMQRHRQGWRLTPEGVQQTRVAGICVNNIIQRDQGVDKKVVCFVSEVTEAMDTAWRLGIPNAEWHFKPNLHSRGRGEDSAHPRHTDKTRHAGSSAYQKSDPFHWKVKGGESHSEVCLRADLSLNSLDPEKNGIGRNTVVVCHPDFILGCRFRLEYLTQAEYMNIDSSTDEEDKVRHGQVWQYSKQNPKDKNDIRSTYCWFRMMCPTSPIPLQSKWCKIHRKPYNNQDMKSCAERTKSVQGELDSLVSQEI